MDINKTKQLTELKDYIDSLSDKYHAKYTNQVRGIMYNIKRKGNLTNEELGLILGIPETKVESILHETWDGHVSTKLVTKLQLLSCGVFGLPGCQMRKVEIDTIDNQFDKILCPFNFCDDEPKQADDEPDVDIFNMLLGIFDGDSEFQETMRKKYDEYKERGAQILREVEEKYRSAKKTAETAKKIAKATKALDEAARDTLDKVIKTASATSDSTQKHEHKDEENPNGCCVKAKVYYTDKNGELKPISLEDAIMKWSEFINKLAN